MDAAADAASSSGVQLKRTGSGCNCSGMQREHSGSSCCCIVVFHPLGTAAAGQGPLTPALPSAAAVVALTQFSHGIREYAELFAPVPAVRGTLTAAIRPKLNVVPQKFTQRALLLTSSATHPLVFLQGTLALVLLVLVVLLLVLLIQQQLSEAGSVGNQLSTSTMWPGAAATLLLGSTLYISCLA
jgi:hypothetical protein